MMMSSASSSTGHSLVHVRGFLEGAFSSLVARESAVCSGKPHRWRRRRRRKKKKKNTRKKKKKKKKKKEKEKNTRKKRSKGRKRRKRRKGRGSMRPQQKRQTANKRERSRRMRERRLEFRDRTHTFPLALTVGHRRPRQSTLPPPSFLPRSRPGWAFASCTCRRHVTGAGW